MRHAKLLGLLAVVAAALMAFAGTASATELTDKNKEKIEKVEVRFTAGLTQVDGSSGFSCNHSVWKTQITNTGSPTETVVASGTSLEFTECGPDTVTVLDPGFWEVHTKNAVSDNTGRFTASGVAVTLVRHRTIFGFPITTHCIFELEHADIGELTGSDHGEPKHTTATLHVSAPFKTRVTDSACTTDAVWTATYEIATPDHVYVD